MKRLLIIGSIAVTTLAGSLVLLDRQPGSGQETAPPLAPIPAAVDVVADGVVQPVNRAELAFGTAGLVASVDVTEGDRVATGQTLATLDDTAAAASVAQADAAVVSAQASATAAEAVVAGAEAQFAAAEQAASEAANAADAADASLKAARGGVDSAEASVDKAQAAKAALPSGASNAQVDGADADIDLAKGQRRSARADQEVARAQASAASDGAAQAQLQVDVAKAGLDEAEASAVAAEARVEEAIAAADQARAVAAELELVTPISGVVSSVDVKPGDETGPSAIAIRVADHSAWEVVTSDLNEAQVAKIDEGAPVALSFDALPRTTATGTVSMVGLYGEPYQGSIVYPVTVVPADPIEGLRWGMTATVTIDTSSTSSGLDDA
jgi:multidrug efflux pump subunit AcrA (membrane-fusion protein)